VGHHGVVAVSRTDAVLLVVAVAAVSTSAPLVKEAAAPALAVAFWRNALASGGLVPLAGVRARRADHVARDRRAWTLTIVAGLLLAAHFATWISSLSYTTVAASVVLVSTQPIWCALLARARGEPVSRQAWAGIGLAFVGVAVATGVDLGGSGRALRGDGLALAGGALAAGYVSVGAVVRRTVSTTDYTAGCYSVAAVALLLAALVGDQHLSGFGVRTWLCLAAITVGPQLLGHSVFNRLLRTVGPTIVSVAVLGEIVGASLLAAWWFGQDPPAGLIPAAVCIGVGVVLVVRSASPERVGLTEIEAG
jgi:drug/metabolite transporter (DMT)-like permease